MERLFLILLPLSLFVFSCEDVSNGVNGEDGLDGENGIDGNNGLNTLVSTENEPEGDNCLEGGTKVSFGLDEDEDGFLDITEIRNIFYLCNGEDGQDGEDFVINTSSDSIFVKSWIMDTTMEINSNGTFFSSVDNNLIFVLIMLENRIGIIEGLYNDVEVINESIFEWTYNDDYLIFFNSSDNNEPFEIYPYSFNSDSTRLYLKLNDIDLTNTEGSFWVFR